MEVAGLAVARLARGVGGEKRRDDPSFSQFATSLSVASAEAMWISGKPYSAGQ